GKEQTLPMMMRYQESTDRALRESSWRAVSERRLNDAPQMDAIFDTMIEKRDRVARNAGFNDFIGYAFKSKKRFDYTPKASETFHRAVEKAVVPFLRREDDR